MIRLGAFSTEPWQVRETSLELDLLAQSESLFALSNGHLGLRGNLDEGDPHGIPGTYLGGFYESHPLPYAERGYGYPEAGQTVVDVTNGKLVRLLVGDEPLDVRYGRLLSHERVLDLRAGTLGRQLEWESPVGVRVRVRSTRLVSFTRRAVAAIAYEVELLDNPSRLTLQSELVANETQPERIKDPRTASALRRPLLAVSGHVQGDSAVLLHRTRMSGLLLAAGMDHRLSAPGQTVVTTEANGDWARTTVVGDGEPGFQVTDMAFGGSQCMPGAGLSAPRIGPCGELDVLDQLYERALHRAGSSIAAREYGGPSGQGQGRVGAPRVQQSCAIEAQCKLGVETTWRNANRRRLSEITSELRISRTSICSPRCRCSRGSACCNFFAKTLLTF